MSGSCQAVRAVARSENPRGHVILGGDNVPSLVEIGLTDLPKSGGARAPLAPPLATGLSTRAIARYGNPVGHTVLGGDNVSPLVEIGLTDLPKSGGARAPSAPRLRRACEALA